MAHMADPPTGPTPLVVWKLLQHLVFGFYFIFCFVLMALFPMCGQKASQAIKQCKTQLEPQMTVGDSPGGERLNTHEFGV